MRKRTNADGEDKDQRLQCSGMALYCGDICGDVDI